MLLPAGVAPEARLLLIGRALRAFTDGYVAILLPAYLLALGLGKWEVGLISAPPRLLGSALMTLAVGQWGHRFPQRRLLLAAALLMAVTGLLLAGLRPSFWPLLIDRLRRHDESEFRRCQRLPAAGARAAGRDSARRRTHRPVRPLHLHRRALRRASVRWLPAFPTWLTARTA